MVSEEPKNKYLVKPWEVLTCRNNHACYLAPVGIPSHAISHWNITDNNPVYSMRSGSGMGAERFAEVYHLVKLEHTGEVCGVFAEPICKKCGCYIFNCLAGLGVVGVYVRGKLR